MSTLPEFADRQISITLTGAEWFALLAKINDKHSLNAKGRARYKAAVDGIAAQIDAENDRTEADAPRWRAIEMDDSIEVVDQDDAPVFSVMCIAGDDQVTRAVNLAVRAPEMFDALLKVRGGIVDDFPDMCQDPDTSQGEWIAKIDAAIQGVVRP